ncbi:MAG: hypothetical protein U1F56_13855 [Rubrivivax sp.]
MYVTSEVANTVYAVDVASGKVAHQVKTGKRPRRFALTPDGAQLWVSNELDASVSVIDTATHQVVRRWPRGQGRAQGRHHAGRVADHARRQARLRELSAPTTWRSSTWPRARSPTWCWWRAGLALDKAEKTLLVVNGLSDDVSIVDVATAKALKSVKVGRVPYGAVIVE